MTRVVAFVGARLSSSRLPGKHLLDLAGKPLIARIFDRLDRIPSLSHAVLATTDEPVNQPLIAWARAAGRAYFAWNGDVNDLVGRIDAAVQAEQPEILFYLCGDCPLIEPTLIERKIAALCANPHADFVRVEPRDGRGVIHQGIDAYPIHTWRRTVAASNSPHEREHVGSAVATFFGDSTVVTIEDEPVFYRLQHRISVDTPSDYRFMQTIYEDWYAHHPADSMVDLRHVVARLEAEPELRAINAAVKQKGVLEQSVPVLLLTAADASMGLGHLRRMLVLTRALQDGAAAGVRLLIQGEAPDLPQLKLAPHTTCTNLAGALDHIHANPRILVCDLPRRYVTPQLQEVLARRPANCRLISIDNCLPPETGYHLNWVPSFYQDPSKQAPNMRFGWHTYLIEKPISKPWRSRANLVVLTGGSDAFGQGHILPDLLEKELSDDVTVTWVQGPFAPKPHCPSARFTVLHNPPNMAEVLQQAGYALCVYGVSFFECLAQGLPTVVFAPDRTADDAEWQALKTEAVALAAETPMEAVRLTNQLIQDQTVAGALAMTAEKKLDGLGGKRLTEALMGLL